MASLGAIHILCITFWRVWSADTCFHNRRDFSNSLHAFPNWIIIRCCKGNCAIIHWPPLFCTLDNFSSALSMPPLHVSMQPKTSTFNALRKSLFKSLSVLLCSFKRCPGVDWETVWSSESTHWTCLLLHPVCCGQPDSALRRGGARACAGQWDYDVMIYSKLYTRHTFFPLTYGTFAHTFELLSFGLLCLLYMQDKVWSFCCLRQKINVKN